MSMEDRSKREIIEHYKLGQSQLGLATQRIITLEAEAIRLEERVKTLEDALDKASNVFRQVAECVLRSGGSVPKEDLMEIYRVCEEQALAAKEPTV